MINNAMLYVIPTPIGNTKDITLRALELFKEIKFFLCEDTRTTKKLLKIYEIEYKDKDFSSLTSYTKPHTLKKFIELIRENDVALVSEAGCPGLSDPGKVLIQLCTDNDLPFTVLPGANALIPALVASGFPTHHFRFLGFLPQKKGKLTLLKEIVESSEPVFVYESVHRVVKTMLRLKDLGFKGKVSVARELSKLFEELITADIDEIIDLLQSGEMPVKGEFVLGFWTE